MKLLTSCLLAITCICLTGCGTISSLSTNYDKLPQERKYVFSGVRQDCGVAFSSEAKNHVPLWMRGGATVDILISAVADTYCLPYTIPKAISDKKKLKESSIGIGTHISECPSHTTNHTDHVISGSADQVD